MEKILDISWGTIFKIALAVLLFYLIYAIRDILVLILFSLMIAILFNPAIDFLTRKKIPRIISTILVYLSIFGMLGAMIYFIAPIFVYEIQQFTQFFPQYFEKFAPVLKGIGFEIFTNFESFTKAIEEWLLKASSSIFNAIGAFFGGIFAAITIFSIAMFLSWEEKGIERAIILIFPKKHEANILSIWHRSRNQISGWFATRILSSIFVGVLVFVACEILVIKYGISFGLLAGITNIVPIIGPLITGTIILLFTALDSMPKAIFILVIFIIIQQIEGNILSPILTKKFIGMPPVLVLIALLIGAELWGILGAILVIPISGILLQFIKEFFVKKKEEKVLVL
ncbi:AI-2E family transporter [Patescibacteria group bacterium]